MKKLESKLETQRIIIEQKILKTLQMLNASVDEPISSSVLRSNIVRRGKSFKLILNEMIEKGDIISIRRNRLNAEGICYHYALP